MEAVAGGGGFSVDPAELTAAAERIRSASARVREAGASGSLRACVATGSPDLDAALGEFDADWSTTVSRVSDAGDDLAGALSSAASAYAVTDACVVPGG